MGCGQFLNQPSDLLDPFAVFFFRINIRIVEEDGDRKIIGQIFQHIAAAGRAAAVKQQCRNMRLFLFYDMFQFFLIISLVQNTFLLCSSDQYTRFLHKIQPHTGCVTGKSLPEKGECVILRN
jgi:hypothetical protein